MLCYVMNAEVSRRHSANKRFITKFILVQNLNSVVGLLVVSLNDEVKLSKHVKGYLYPSRRVP